MSDFKGKILVGVATSEWARHASFYDHYILLDKPVGTLTAFTHGSSPAEGRNRLIESALENDCTHILFLDDDITVQPDTLTKLLSHEKDIVSGYYVMRQYPHQGLVFDKQMEDGQNRWLRVNGQTGLMEVTSTGLGCVLFNLKIFENLEKPWVRLGEIQKDGWCDDIGLYNRLRANGHKIHVDLNAPVGHIGVVTITPVYKDGKWAVSYDTKGKGIVQFVVESSVIP